MNEFKPITILLVILLFVLQTPAAAGDLQIPYISKGACPFECCAYGRWPVIKDTQAYSKPDKNASVVAELHAGEIVNAVTGDVHIIPGRAKATGKPHSSASELDLTKDILILDYTGEGYSQVYQDGNFYSVKIARTKKRCQEAPNWRYCWAEVLEEPITEWWVFIKAIDGKVEGWVLMEEEALKPSNRCSRL
jgi:hypothetical protein